jgi:hypothetical protein
MFPAAIVVFLLAIVADRLCARRSIALLSLEQKAAVLNATSRGNVWFFVCLAIFVACSWWLVPPLPVPAPYRPGFMALYPITLFFASVAARGNQVRRLSRLGLPRTYVRGVGLGAILYHVGLLLLISAIVYGIVIQLRLFEERQRSSNHAMQPTAGRCDASFSITSARLCNLGSLSPAVAHLVLVRPTQACNEGVRGSFYFGQSS